MRRRGSFWSANAEGAVYMLTPAPVRGIGSGSDFKMQLQDRAGYDRGAAKAA
ncbi:MAG: hypothetical protein ACLUKN_16855 [Bacilli bacterium]